MPACHYGCWSVGVLASLLLAPWGHTGLLQLLRTCAQLLGSFPALKAFTWKPSTCGNCVPVSGLLCAFPHLSLTLCPWSGDINDDTGALLGDGWGAPKGT